MYVCTHTYIYVCNFHALIHAYRYFIHIYKCIHTRIHTWMYACMHTYMFAYIYTNVCMYAYICIHTYTHTPESTHQHATGGNEAQSHTAETI